MMRVWALSPSDRRRLVLILVFGLISSGFSLAVSWQPVEAQARLSLADILTGLKSKKVTLAERNRLLTDAVGKRGVTFALTPEIESELRATGATNALVEAIRYNGPQPVKVEKPVVQNNQNGVTQANTVKQRADDTFDAKNFRASIPDYDRAIQLNPTFTNAYLRRGFAYNYLGDFTRAFSDYEKAMELDPKLRTEAYLVCIYYKVGDDPATVLKNCNEALTQYNEFSLAYFSRAVAQRNLKNYDGAVADYSEAIRLYPSFAYAYLNRSVVYINYKNNYSAGIADATAALRYDASLDRAYYFRGLGNYYLKDFNAALPDLNKAIQMKPDDTSAMYFRGVVYFEQENYSPAIADFTKVLAKDPQDLGSLRYRGLAYYYLKDYNAAIEDYSAAIRIEPSANSFRNRALAYDGLGKRDLAAADRRRAAQMEK